MKYIKFLIISILILFIGCLHNPNGTDQEKKNLPKQNPPKIIRKIERKEALEIVEKSLKAKGVDALDRFKDLTIFCYREIPKSPDGPKKINLTIFYKFPNKVRIDTEVFIVAKDKKFSVIETYDGASAWIYENNSFKKVSEIKEKELKGMASISFLKGSLYLLSAGKYEFVEAREEKNDKEYYVIKMSSKEEEKKDFNIYIDVNSYLPAIEEMTAPKLMGFTEVKVKTFIESYVNVEGFMLPAKTRRFSSIGPFKEEMETIVKKAEVNKNLTDFIFQSPKH